MSFYKDSLGGELSFNTVNETPQSNELPETMKNYIVQASLKKENMLLMGTDMCDEKLINGNAISILLECTTANEAYTYYNKLKDGGVATHPIAKTFWGALFGGLTDKYGHQWLFHYKK